MPLSENGKLRGGAVLLHTSLNRDDIFTWQEEVIHANPDLNVWLVDTWTFTDHAAPDGSTFTLYACTIVLTEGEMISAVSAQERMNKALREQSQDIGDRLSRQLDNLSRQFAR